MILASGCFDGLHAGHVSYLRACAQLRLDGEPLLVAVAPDAYLRRHKDREPRWSVIDRLSVIYALDMVDEAKVHGDNGVEDVILEYRPRLLVKADDWKDRLTDAVLKACHDSHTSILFVPQRASKHTREVA